ncbi:MAG TPA: winged helix-turn-helix domain-containing protein [Terriglobales bacterium]|nr:winged helix-turn-helix domain-containing protein [Terriglobales bacterium]
MVFRFGVFEADASTGELRKSGVRLKLQEQPFQVLLSLLERRGEVVTREQLRQRLWPADTFVDFDHSLNTIINKLREVLGDSAANPRFIETLARRGYRFLPPVEVTGNGREAGASTLVPAGSPAAGTAENNPPTSSFLTSAEELPAVPHGYVRILFLLIQVMYLGFYIAALARIPAVEDALEQPFGLGTWAAMVVLVSAAIGIPIRLYFLSAVSFNVRSLSQKFLRMFVPVFILDELWALAPFLLVRQIGWGLALGATAALIYVPFAERTLVLMRDRSLRN